MKLLLLRIKLFFALPEVKLFFKVFFISAPIVGCTSYYAYPYITWVFERRSMIPVYEQIEEIVGMPRTTNSNMVFEQSHAVDLNTVEPLTDDEFWIGDALDYRYTVPKHGVPER